VEVTEIVTDLFCVEHVPQNVKQK